MNPTIPASLLLCISLVACKSEPTARVVTTGEAKAGDDNNTDKDNDNDNDNDKDKDKDNDKDNDNDKPASPASEEPSFVVGRTSQQAPPGPGKIQSPTPTPPPPTGEVKPGAPGSENTP